MKTAVGPKGTWSALPRGRTITGRLIVVFQYTSEDGDIVERFAAQKCECGKPMVEFFREKVTIELPGISHYDTPGKPQEGSGWVIWCDTCQIHAGPHDDREKTISDWNEAVEALRVIDDL